MEDSVKALIDEYGAAVAARVAAVLLAANAGIENAPLVTEAKERERIAKDALETSLAAAAALVSQSIISVEAIANAKPVFRADLHIRNTYKTPADLQRPYSLKDAKPDARLAAKMLREAWDLVDPASKPKLQQIQTNHEA